MSDAAQSAPPAKKQRLETAQEAHEAACKKHSSLEAELLHKTRKDPSSKVVSTSRRRSVQRQSLEDAGA